ncbi:hypothetical protein [Microbulbifer sp. VAAF005]|uniref:hypothetical protein n=1 Tax=Microbulbifer sp. VAAF005 TaxID=3034230 RepID=UPI0024ACF451|nr:hypothetical protein [Microbulbifer sp. VAAF005]WHI48964.1 hypothetical protein P0078_11610 [Microbulbifer sp. VAAF005]
MEIDIEYIKEVLEVFLNAKDPTVTIYDFPMFEYNDITTDEMKYFFFHLEILRDQGFVEGSIGDPRNIGFKFNPSAKDYVCWSVPIRLCASGHDCAAALAKPGVIDTLKTTFKDLGPSETVKVVFKLAEKATNNLVAKALGE